MDQKAIFIDAATHQLNEFYTKLRQTKQSDEIMKAKVEGFMFAGVVLGLVNNDEFKQLVEDVHFDVFGMTVAERRMKSALNSGDEDSWSVYDEPSWKRNRR